MVRQVSRQELGQESEDWDEGCPVVLIPVPEETQRRWDAEREAERRAAVTPSQSSLQSPSSSRPSSASSSSSSNEAVKTVVAFQTVITFGEDGAVKEQRTPVHTANIPVEAADRSGRGSWGVPYPGAPDSACVPLAELRASRPDFLQVRYRPRTLRPNKAHRWW